MKEFNLKEKRKEILHKSRGNSDILRTLNQVEEQDKEFIMLLIENRHCSVDMQFEIKKLSGGL